MHAWFQGCLRSCAALAYAVIMLYLPVGRDAAQFSFSLWFFVLDKMVDKTISTNLLLDALIKNMESYESDHTCVDNFTLSQFLKLVDIIDSFISDATVEPDKEEKEALVKNCYLQNDAILCRHCNQALNSRQDAHSHWRTHETKTSSSSEIDAEAPEPGDPPIIKPLPLETPSAVGSKYLERNCIPKNMEYLSKKVKTFLSKDANEVAKKLYFESYYLQQDQKNLMVLMDLTCSLQPFFPLTKCYLFGSRTFGTARFESDIDIFANLENNYCGRKGSVGKLDPRKSVQLTAALLEKNSSWRILCVTTTARIPVLQVIHTSFNLKCDISFTSGLAHCNSLLLNYLFNLQPTCRALVCYIKNWNSDSSLTGYAIALMAVFFFQCQNLLPSVHRLQNDLRAARYIDDWNAGFTTLTLTQLGIPPCTVPISTLTKQFFAFYSNQDPNFSLETDVVCPFLGHYGIKKSMFHTPDASGIPTEMFRLRSYTCQHKNDSNRLNLFAYDRPFVIQDPFELCHNVAKGLNECQAAKYLRKFHQCSIFQPSTNDV